MAIRSDEELAQKVAEASALLQEIQDYVGRDFSKPVRIRFPRGYLRTAAEAEEESRSLRMQISEATSLTQCSSRTFNTGYSYVLIYQVQPKK